MSKSLSENRCGPLRLAVVARASRARRGGVDDGHGAEQSLGRLCLRWISGFRDMPPTRRLLQGEAQNEMRRGPKRTRVRGSRVGSGFLQAAGLFVTLVCLAGCSRPLPESETVEPPQFDLSLVDGQRAYSEVEQLLAVGLRDSGTDGAARAAEHLKARLEALGISAHIDSFENLCPLGEVTFRNVIGTLPGAGEGLIIVCSHYDTKAGMDPGFTGANDSGSSSGLVLELARVMSQGLRVAPEIQFVFFDGEECMEHYGARDGLHGSKYMAAQLVESGRSSKVLAMILLDMIGDKDLSVTIPRNGTPELVSGIFRAAHEEGVRHLFTLYPGSVGDDHVPFLQAGMPAVDLIDFRYGSTPGRNDYWHTSEDTIDKISAESLETVGRVTLRLVNSLL